MLPLLLTTLLLADPSVTDVTTDHYHVRSAGPDAALAFANEPEARAAFEGKKGVFLRIVNAADGKTVSQISLPAMPAFDGMSTAGGKLYISLQDGTVTCFGK